MVVVALAVVDELGTGRGLYPHLEGDEVAGGGLAMVHGAPPNAVRTPGGSFEEPALDAEAVANASRVSASNALIRARLPSRWSERRREA